MGKGRGEGWGSPYDLAAQISSLRLISVHVFGNLNEKKNYMVKFQESLSTINEYVNYHAHVHVSKG